ncbi:MAG TPA: hypothetical protein VLF42_02865 [Burkholderiales bacterium]|nr:hypothetical protein [Burkholderiales bacterium]
MNSLCLTGDGLTASLFAAALHFGWTPADGIAREESWHVYQGKFEFLAERVRKGGDWQHAWPARAPQPRLVFDRRGLREDYVICGEMWCTPLEKLLPRARAPVVRLAPC